MLSTEVLNIVMGASSFLGIAGLIAYFYFTIQARHAKFSVRDLLDGESLLNEGPVLKFLLEFEDESKRLEAFMALAHLDRAKAGSILKKVDRNIDLIRLSESSAKHRQRSAIITAGFFSMLTVLVLAYSLWQSGENGSDSKK